MAEDLKEGDKGSAELIIEKANKYIQTLHSPQIDLTPDNEYALFDFNHKNRETFDYFAPSSQFTYGLPLMYMNPKQQGAAMELLKASLSKKGFKKVLQIHSLEDVLAKRESTNPIFIRDSKAYYISIFGLPSSHGFWSWRIQGHHLSLQWTILNGKVISSTPQFLGAQPAEIKGGDEVGEMLPLGERVLKDLEDLARDLIEKLSSEQQQLARAEVPWDIDTTNVHDPLIERRPHRLEDSGTGIRGIAYAKLEIDKQELFRKLVQEHASVQLDEIIQERISKIEKAGWGSVKFFLMGGHRRGDALYYRLRGDTFLIEYINKAFTVPNLPADHQHSVWRDFAGDWGRDTIVRLSKNGNQSLNDR